MSYNNGDDGDDDSVFVSVSSCRAARKLGVVVFKEHPRTSRLSTCQTTGLLPFSSRTVGCITLLVIRPSVTYALVTQKM